MALFNSRTLRTREAGAGVIIGGIFGLLIAVVTNIDKLQSAYEYFFGPNFDSSLVGEYQVVLGAQGGCNDAPAHSTPVKHASITTDGKTLTAINECGSQSKIGISSDAIFLGGDRAWLWKSGRNVTIIDEHGNSWVKLTR